MRTQDERKKGEPSALKILKEINGFFTEDPTRHCAGFGDLKDDGSTTCASWIYSGVYPAAGKNLADRRTPDADVAVRGRPHRGGRDHGPRRRRRDARRRRTRSVMPGFIDAHTHMDMPFGGTITAGRLGLGHRGGRRGRDDGARRLRAPGHRRRPGGRHRHVAGQGDGTDAHRLRPARGRCDLNDAVKAEIPVLNEHGVCTVKVFMAYKGTPLFMPDEGLLEIMQIARDAGVMVMVHAENGDAIAKLQEQALARGDVDPIWHARTRPEAVEAEATGAAIRLAEIADTVARRRPRDLRGRRRRDPPRPRPRPGRARRDVPPVPGDDDRRPRQPEFEGAKYVCSPPLRDASNHDELWRAPGNRRAGARRLGPLRVRLRRPEGVGRGDFTKIPNGMPGVEERAPILWTNGVRTGRISPERSSPCSPPTRRTCTGCCRARG